MGRSLLTTLQREDGVSKALFTSKRQLAQRMAATLGTRRLGDLGGTWLRAVPSAVHLTRVSERRSALISGTKSASLVGRSVARFRGANS